MKRRLTIAGMAVLALSLNGERKAAAQSAGRELEGLFASPRDSDRVFTWWHWMNGHISREAITRDLEAMKRAGLGGALIFNVGIGMQGAPGPVRTFTPEWWGAIEHAMRECRRLGLKFGMHNCDGWSQSGGPWVQAQDSMKQVVWTETRLDAGQPRARLPQPAAREGFYRDIAVLALPVAGEEIDGLRMSPGPEGKWWDLEFPVEVEARAISLGYKPLWRSFPPLATSDVSVETAGGWRTIRTFSLGWRPDALATITVDFPATRAKRFRIAPRKPGEVSLVSAQAWSAPRLGYWEPKAGFATHPMHGGETGLFAAYPPLREQAGIRRSEIQDVTSRMKPDGELEWRPPAGRWTLLRVGFTSTGKRVGTATKEGSGLECDKMDRAAVEKHFDGMLGEFVRRYPAFMKSTFAFAELDSWEAGIQNWTAKFPELFRERRGYDLRDYLPVIAGGRVVESYDSSERFLRDFRRTIGDLFHDEYRSVMRKLADRSGFQLIVEGSGRQQYLYEPLDNNKSAAIPMGEFWTDEGVPRVDNKAAASIAHTYGTRIVASESYTSGGTKHFELDPYSMKSLGDRAFAAGVNWFVLHSYVHQPYDWLRPGLALSRFGAHFHRNNTWFEQSRPWFDYLARCQAMLRQGQFVADVAYLPGEDVPAYLGWKHELRPALPPGYDFDGITRELVLNRLAVRDGRLELPGGMSYRALLLPDARRMTPELARRVRELVRAGATVVGPKPEGSPSLSGGAASDREVAAIAAELWDRGKGGVIGSSSFEQVFASLGVAPDFEFRARHPDAAIHWIHRRDGETDIYFLANEKYRPEEVVCTFRVAGKQPELWHPDTGKTEPVRDFRVTGGRTGMSIPFDPAGSVFVIFRKPGGAPQPSRAAAPPPRPVELAPEWTLSFPNGATRRLPKLISWPRDPDPNVKYFSGTATYRASFQSSGAAPSRLCLGAVKNIAEVRLNGVDLGAAWKEPFCVETGSVLRAGSNQLEVRVTNLWVNRMIGDEQLPPDADYAPTGQLRKWPEWAGKPGARTSGRQTFVIHKFYDKDSPLLESGLLGPVTLQPLRRNGAQAAKEVQP